MKVFLLLLSTIIYSSNLAKAKSDEIQQVEVRAVFINCERNDREGLAGEKEATRFEREELFKHGLLQDCNKKIALTVKITGDPYQDKNSVDEYIPVEHVFQGSNQRVRLLDPYVLRLRREMPLQAYKLRRMSTVSGVLSNTNDEHVRGSKEVDEKSRSRTKRSQNSDEITGKSRNAEGCDLTENNLSNSNVSLFKRDKRHEHNIMVEDAVIEERYPQWMVNGHFIQEHDKNIKNRNNFAKTSRNFHHNIEEQHIIDKKQNQYKSDENPNHFSRSDSWDSYPNEQDNINTGNKEHDWFPKDNIGSNTEHSTPESYRGDIDITSDNEFDMYDIGNPDLLYTVHVQLFEKLTTPQGKTVWSDMTKGEPASVSTFSPEWVGPNMNIRYRPTEWIPREEFTLPLSSLCLLTPLPNSHFKVADTDSGDAGNGEKKYIVVPKEDIFGFENDSVQKREGNSSNDHATEQNEQCRRRVMIRTTRAIFGSNENKLNIVLNGEEQYLTLPHRRQHRAQIDLEARADENQLVPIGSFGRIMTVVSDSSRKTRTTITVQVTNTGLAAAKFRAVARDCGPELMGLQNDKNFESFSDSPVLLPPRHTRNIRLDVPAEMPADIGHCFVSLVNDEDESVAVRDVTIKKGDRCFCVWHCECVCLSEDPKLLCREMTEARQIAAGLSLRERVRHARSVCYHDVVSINMLVTAFGVLTTLLFFGLVKACVGLIFRCIGSWGLHRIVQMPRKLEHYYESSLQDCPVVYDGEGWPVHPSTKERTVRLVSKPMEFILNVIFFVITPCIIIYNILKEIYSRCKKSEDTNSWRPCEKDKSCYSSHDIQEKKTKWRRRRRRHAIKKWMTPEAEDLSTNIWQGNLPGKTAVDCMLPLLRKEFGHGEKAVQQFCVDSEADDTEYVLMQMQKSKESLARSQRKLNGSDK